MTDTELRHKFLDWLYPVPDEGDSGDRRFHDDLLEMTDLELQCEFDRLKHRLLFDPNPTPWLIDRHDRIESKLNEHPY